MFIAGLPQRGLGLALKAEDGAGRAAEVALLAALTALGEVPPSAAHALVPFAQPTLFNYAGAKVGRIAPAPGWPEAAT